MDWRFEDYVDNANAASSKEELFRVYLTVIKTHGLDRALFALMTDHNATEKAGVGVIHNFPDDWMSYYFEHQLDKIDPVIAYGANQVGAYKWEDISKKLHLTKRQRECLNFGQEAGLKNGLSTYMRNGHNQIAGVSLATTEKKDAFDGRSDLIFLYSQHFYASYRKLSQIDEIKPELITLTPAERDVLLWCMHGSKTVEIAEKLCVSRDTVNYHLRNIFEKLGARTKMMAVVKAQTLGLLRL